MRRSLQALSLIVVTIIVFVTYTMFDVHMLMRRISIHYFSPKVSFHYLSSNILVYFIYGDQTTVQRKRLMNVCLATGQISDKKCFEGIFCRTMLGIIIIIIIIPYDNL